MRNQELADIFYEIADTLEILEDDRFKPIAYRRVARQIETLGQDIETLWRQGELRSIPGVGTSLAEKIDEFLRTGGIAIREELKQRVPQGLLDVMKVPSVGPKTARVLWRDLNVRSLEDLKEAIESGRLRSLKGFKARTEENMLRGIELVRQGRERMLLWKATAIANIILDHLRKCGEFGDISVAGSLRRRRETVGDLDILATGQNRKVIMDTFVSMPIVNEVVLRGDTKSTIITREGLQVDLRVLDSQSWGSGLQYFTGCKDHNVRLRTLAQRLGLKLSEYGVYRGEERVAGATEREVYRVLGCDYIEPELREDSGEIEAALNHELPRLVTENDIKGEFHVHTNHSDGMLSLQQTVREAARLDYDYVGISDHSPSLSVAGGLSPENFLRVREEIEGMNVEMETCVCLLGTECDILGDGSLDYPDEVLEKADYVIAAIHSKFNQPEDEITERIAKALRNPMVNILAHPLTRLIGQRDSIKANFDYLFEIAAEENVCLEINGFPNRMDLPGEMIRLAKSKGCKFVVSTDAHATGHFGYISLGVGLARRGWLEAQDIVNTWDLDLVRDFFR